MLGERIRSCRKAAKMTQQDLAVALGVHTMTISYYERGEWTPPAERLEQIAAALNVDLPTLTHGGTGSLQPDAPGTTHPERSSSA